MPQRVFFSFIMLAVFGGCSSAPFRDPLLEPDRQIITQDEIEASHGSTAHDVISIPATQLAEIRLYRAWEAVGKFGSGLPGGAIAIYTRLER